MKNRNNPLRTMTGIEWFLGLLRKYEPAHRGYSLQSQKKHRGNTPRRQRASSAELKFFDLSDMMSPRLHHSRQRMEVAKFGGVNPTNHKTLQYVPVLLRENHPR